LSRRLGARVATLSLIAAPILGAVALSSCAAGADAMTGLTRTTTNSVAGAVGTVALRNVYVVGPAQRGGSAQVISAFFNDGAQNDEIIGVSSPGAETGRPPSSPVLEPGGSNIYIADGTAPTLLGLKSDLEIGSRIEVTFTLAKAGSVTLLAPVEPAAAGAWRAPAATPTPTATPKATTAGAPSARAASTAPATAASPGSGSPPSPTGAAPTPSAAAS
jgi:copper(I)-binding protein